MLGGGEQEWCVNLILFNLTSDVMPGAAATICYVTFNRPMYPKVHRVQTEHEWELCQNLMTEQKQPTNY